MPSVVNDIILWLSPTFAALLVWLCNVIFSFVNEKIQTTKEIHELKLIINTLSLKQEGFNNKLGSLESGVNAKLEKIDVMVDETKTQVMMSEKKLSATLFTVEEHSKKHLEYGRVFTSLTEYLKNQKKHEKH